MVKKAEEDWKTISNNLNNSTTVRKYLDLCKDWLISNDQTTESNYQFCNIKIKQIPFYDGNTLGLNEIDLRCIETFACIICKKKSSLQTDGKHIIANPFTRAQFTLMCGNCTNKINSYR